MNSIRQMWQNAMEIPGAGWIVGVFGLVTCVLVGLYLVKLVRDMALGNTETTVSHLEEFQRLHAEGKLNSNEYSKLKKTLPDHIPELRTSSGTSAGSRKGSTAELEALKKLRRLNEMTPDAPDFTEENGKSDTKS